MFNLPRDIFQQYHTGAFFSDAWIYDPWRGIDPWRQVFGVPRLGLATHLGRPFVERPEMRNPAIEADNMRDWRRLAPTRCFMDETGWLCPYPHPETGWRRVFALGRFIGEPS